jgi:hypothetical protein
LQTVVDFFTWLETLPISAHIAETWWFPLLESIHVIFAMFVVGSIVTLDLRLLGLTARNHPVSRISREIVPWTLGAALFALVAGVGLFASQANRYAVNRAFQIKLVFLALAAINMAYFHFRTARRMDEWDTAPVASRPARLAGALSIVFWVGVTLAGRWTGHL